MSFEPPGGDVTMSRIGLLGKGVCASANPKERTAASSRPRAVLMRLPPPSIRSYAEKVRMQECEHEVQREPGEHLPHPISSNLKWLRPCMIAANGTLEVVTVK